MSHPTGKKTIMTIVLRCALILATLLLEAVTALAGTGGLDTTFGSGGARFVNFPTASDTARGVAVQADGKIVAVGGEGLGLRRFVAVRHNPDGSLDSTFGAGGIVSIPIGDGFAEANAVALQADGRIVIAGIPGPVGGTSNGGFVLVRLNIDGTLDTTFGGTGKVITEAASSGQAAYAVAVQPDGKIVAAGTTGADFVAVRYNPDGGLDSGFNGGRSVVSLTTGNDIARSLALQADGRVVVAGVTDFGGNADFGVLRLNADGSIDGSFNGTGMVITDFAGSTDAANAVRVQLDGKIVAAGSAWSGSHSAIALVRYLTNGALDAGFGTGGKVTRATDTSVNDQALAVALQADGKIVTSGDSAPSFTPTSAIVARFNADGSYDTAFGTGGVFAVQVLPGPSSAPAVAVQQDGRIVAAGRVTGSSGSYFTALRLLADGTADAGFGSGGMVRTAVSGAFDTALGIALQSDGKSVLLGVTSARPALVRLDSGGNFDGTFADGGRTSATTCTPGVIFCSSLANDVLLLADGRIVTAGATLTTGFNTGSITTGPFAWMVFSPAGALLEQRSTSFDTVYSEALAMALQSDGKLVTVGYSYRPAACCGLGGELPRRIAITRHDAAGALDPAFGGGSGKVTTLFGAQGVVGSAVALQADGKIVVAGSTWPAVDSVLVRYHPDGTLESAQTMDFGGGQNDSAISVAVQADGKIVIAGIAGGQGYVARFNAPGAADATFGVAGKVDLPSNGGIVRLSLQADGKILALGPDFEVFRLDPDGTPDATFGAAGRVPLAVSGALLSRAMALQADGRILIAGRGIGAASQSEDFTVARIDPQAATPLVPAPQSVAFGGQSMHTSTTPRSVTLLNATGTAITVGSLSIMTGSVQTTPSFALTSSNCGTLAAGASCEASVTFTPQAPGSNMATLHVPSTAGLLNITLTGIGERSLVTHYYRAILNRVPDDAGRTYWDGEAARLASLGANLNETWFVMAGYFFNSAEYLAANKTDAQFLGDLYNTFFNRPADASGVAYWQGQIASGLPREVVLFSFLFSDEFRTFTQGIFGNTAARPEVDMVMDLFRGILNRLPDTPSFQYWVGRLRTAQCSGAGYVYSEVDAMSRSFMFSAEYANRARSNTQLVTDMYYSFLRRGGDLGGVTYWIDELQSGRRSADAVRGAFITSPEFGARVQSVTAAGCLPQ
jgi:uncharacterized delta-60 repeat protein